MFDKWSQDAAGVRAIEQGDNIITMFDVIGEDFWSGGGITAKKVASQLRAIGPKPIEVQINSPGGDMFEGIAIYNVLREHPQPITVKVMGMRWSASSLMTATLDEHFADVVQRERAPPIDKQRLLELDKMANSHRSFVAICQKRAAHSRRELEQKLVELDGEISAERKRHEAEIRRLTLVIETESATTNAAIEADRRMIAGSRALLAELEGSARA